MKPEPRLSITNQWQIKNTVRFNQSDADKIERWARLIGFMGCKVYFDSEKGKFRIVVAKKAYLRSTPNECIIAISQLARGRQVEVEL